MNSGWIHLGDGEENRVMKAHLCIVILVILDVLAVRSHGEQANPASIDGVYMMCAEVSGYSGETLELNDGKFRYWFYSDVGGYERKYPLVGTYVFKENRLLLQHPDLNSEERALSELNGQSVLWRDNGLKLWRREKRIHPYAVLIRVPGGRVDKPWANRPSVKLLYDQEMILREEEEYQNRYETEDEPVRSLLRAKTQRNDPELENYISEIRKARTNLNDRILRQLIGRMGYWNTVEAIMAESILSHLYESGRLVPESPPFIATEKAFHEALSLLVEAMTEAKDSRALTSTLIIFLRVSKVGKMDLAIPEAGIRIRLEASQGGAYSEDVSRIEGSEIQPKDYKWEDEIEVISKACQKWCRLAISNRGDTE